MRKLLVVPEQAGYSVNFGNEVLSAELDGGPSRTRRGFIGAVASVPVAWSLPMGQAEYLLAFFRTATEVGSEPFLVDLIIDHAALSEYTAKFEPGSFKIGSVKGLQTSFSARLQVKPNVPDTANDNLILDAYEAFGEDDPLGFFDLLADFVNVQFPAAFPG
jgi:hypothetical protein